MFMKSLATTAALALIASSAIAAETPRAKSDAGNKVGGEVTRTKSDAGNKVGGEVTRTKSDAGKTGSETVRVSRGR